MSFAPLSLERRTFRAPAQRAAATSSAADVLNLCREATQANLATPSRRGNVIELAAPAVTDVLISADLHGHSENYAAIVDMAALDSHPGRHLILQEVCHGGEGYTPAACKSHAMLEAVMALKLRYPERVHFILSNHELSELTGYPIRKDGQVLLLRFLLGIHNRYGDETEAVHAAYGDFIRSCPLAVRIAQKLFVSHSAPEKVDLQGFDAGVLERPLRAADLAPRGPAFDLVWGRDYRPENSAAFAQAVGAKWLVHGHTPCANGYNVVNSQQLILDCSGAPAACLLVSLSQVETWEQILAGIRLLGQPAAAESVVEPAQHLDSKPHTPATTDSPLTGVSVCLQQALEIDGAVAVAIVDSLSGLCLGTAGDGDLDLAVAAAGEAEVLRAKRACLASYGCQEQIDDMTFTMEHQVHILKTVSCDSKFFLFLVLKRDECNLALARRTLTLLDQELAIA